MAVQSRTAPALLAAAFLAVALALPPPVRAAEEGSRWPVSIGARASTLGLGLELEYPFLDTLHARALFNQFDYDREDTVSGIRYNAELELQSFGLVADWHPFNNGLRLSLGAILNNNEISARSAPNSSVNIGGTDYIGQVSAAMDFETFAPYFGLGWGGSNAAGFGFSIDLGVLYQREPKLSGSGSVAAGDQGCAFRVNDSGAASVAGASCSAVPSLAGDLEREFRDLDDDLKVFQWYPVLSIGIEYRF